MFPLTAGVAVLLAIITFFSTPILTAIFGDGSFEVEEKVIDSRLTEILESKDCLEMGILSDSSEKVTHCGINSQQIAVKIEQTATHFITL